MKLKTLICVCVLLPLMASLASAKETLRLVANYWEPFTGDTLKNYGVATEVVRAALEKMDYEVEIEIQPWTRVIRGVSTGKFDGTIAIWDLPAWSGEIHFSDPYYHNRIILIKRKDDPFEYNSMEDLAGRVVGVGRDHNYTDEFMQATYFEKAGVTKLKQNLNKLLSGRVDLVITDELIAQHHINTFSHKFPYNDELVIMENTISMTPLRFGVSKKHPDYLKITNDFNQGLAKLRATDELTQIFARHNLIYRP